MAVFFGGNARRRYFFYGSGKTKIWRCFLVVTQDGGIVLAVGSFSFFDGNCHVAYFGGRPYYQNMAVNRHITGTAPGR